MITLASLKEDLQSNRSLGNIIEILKMTALAQFQTFQFREKPNSDYLKELENVFGLLSAKKPAHPYFIERKTLPTAIVIITSDEGFLGGLNTFLVNAGLELRKSPNDEVVVIGERGERYLEDVKCRFSSFPGISDDIRYGEAEKLAAYLIDNYKKKFGKIVVVYPRFISLTHQKVETVQLLPRALVPGASSKMPMWEELSLEPHPGRVIEVLVELWLRFRIFDMFWSAKQSEVSARIMHLEGSGQELQAVNQKLAFSYFRRVHAISDKTIREVSAAKILLGKAVVKLGASDAA